MATNTYIHTHAAAAGAQWCVGSTLRTAREAGSQSLEEISEVLRFRADYLSALEEENYGLLPGWAYVLGYVRAYAEYLGLEPGPLVKKVREQLTLRQHMFQEEQTRRRLSPRALVASAGIAATVLVVVGFGANNTAAGIERLLAPVSTSLKYVVARSADLFAGSGALAPAGAPATADPEQQVAAAQTDRAGRVDPTGSTGNSAAGADIWGPVQALSMVAAPVQYQSQVVVRTHPRGTTDRYALAPQTLVLRAVRPVTLQIEDDTGQIILNRKLNTGELYRTSHGAKLRISTPDAGAVEIYLGGKPAGTLGAPGQALVRASFKAPAPSG